nr:phototropin-2 [Quercus suber]
MWLRKRGTERFKIHQVGTIASKSCICSYFYLSKPLISVHLVELQGTGELYAMKAMEKSMMLNRNKTI